MNEETHDAAHAPWTDDDEHQFSVTQEVLKCLEQRRNRHISQLQENVGFFVREATRQVPGDQLSRNTVIQMIVNGRAKLKEILGG